MKKRRFPRGSLQVVVIAVFMMSCLVSVLNARASAQPQNASKAVAALNWKKCADPIEGFPETQLYCADLRVPLDYQRPNGKKITVKVSKVKAASAQQKRGVLFLNPGGPGGPGVDLPQPFSVIMPQEVVSKYDLIGFDPRGVGQSTPVSCGLNAEEASQAMVPQAQPGGFAATAAFMKKVAKKCNDTSGNLMPHMTTNNTVRDMEQIRKALNVPKISYLGYSYGTYLGAVYASKYPSQTDRFVLDSATGPSWTWREQFRSWRMADRDRFPDFAQYLVDNNQEFKLGSTTDEISKKFYELIEKYNANPLVFEDGSTFGGEQFRLLTFGALYNDGNFPEAGAIWQYLDQTPATLKQPETKQQVESLLGKESSKLSDVVNNNAASALAVLCSDTNWSRTVDQYQAELTADTVIAPRFGSVGSNIWPCAFWKSTAKEPLTPITDKGPRNILVVQNTRDPATPYIGAQDMRAKLGKRAQFVTVDQGGHAAAYLANNTCANDTTSNFLAYGAMASVDTICQAEAQQPGQLSQRQAATQTGEKQKAIEKLRQRIR